MGAAIARNIGIKESKGKYVAFLDSDDLWVKNKLEKQIEFMQKKEVDFSYSEYMLMDEDGKKIKKIAKIIKKLSYSKMLYHCFTGCLTVIYDQEKIGKVEGPDILKSNDYALFLQVLKKTNNAMGIEEVLGFYRVRKNSLSRNKLSKLKPHFYLLNKIEKINKIQSALYIFSNVLIKLLWKYK